MNRTAKRLSKEIVCAKDWDKTNGVQIMHNIALSKFAQVERAQLALEQSGSMILAEAVPNINDTFWGTTLDRDGTLNTRINAWPGENEMGDILMKVRDHMFTEPTEEEWNTIGAQQIDNTAVKSSVNCQSDADDESVANVSDESDAAVESDAAKSSYSADESDAVESDATESVVSESENTEAALDNNDTELETDKADLPSKKTEAVPGKSENTEKKIGQTRKVTDKTSLTSDTPKPQRVKSPRASSVKRQKETPPENMTPKKKLVFDDGITGTVKKANEKKLNPKSNVKQKLEPYKHGKLKHK